GGAGPGDRPGDWLSAAAAEQWRRAGAGRSQYRLAHGAGGRSGDGPAGLGAERPGPDAATRRRRRADCVSGAAAPAHADGPDLWQWPELARSDLKGRPTGRPLS